MNAETTPGGPDEGECTVATYVGGRCYGARQARDLAGEPSTVCDVHAPFFSALALVFDNPLRGPRGNRVTFTGPKP